MDNILAIIKRKPAVFLIVSLGYLVLVGLLKWRLEPPIGALLFLAGAIGVYLLDAAEVFFALNPSPFRSIIFLAGFVVVSLFIATSSGARIAQGLVLSLYLTLILWQIGERQVTGTLAQWYPPMLAEWGLPLFTFIFFIETYLFIAWA